MATDVAASALGRPGLPPLGTYLRAVIALGVGSLRLALPALGLLYFYRLGMALYIAFSGDAASPLGLYDQATLIVTVVMEVVAYLPMLVLIYTPFLPLQDSLLQGERRSFMASARIVLERLVPFVISTIAQLLLTFGPPAFFLVGAGFLAGTLPEGQEEWGRWIVLVTLFPCFFYGCIMALFLLFAMPLLVLENRGPFASIRLSFALIGRQFGGILGRSFVFLILLIIAAIAASIPEAILQASADAAGFEHPAVKIAQAIWSAGVTALMFPFSVAALMVLYRSAVPARGAAAMRSAGPAAEEAPPVTSPYRFE